MQLKRHKNKNRAAGEATRTLVNGTIVCWKLCNVFALELLSILSSFLLADTK